MYVNSKNLLFDIIINDIIWIYILFGCFYFLFYFGYGYLLLNLNLDSWMLIKIW